MRGIRHFFILLCGLVLVAVLASPVAALWSGAGILVGYGVMRLGRFNGGKPSVALAFAITGVVVQVAGAVAVLASFGWAVAAGYVVIAVAFLAGRAND